jgi:hypothetical protein
LVASCEDRSSAKHNVANANKPTKLKKVVVKRRGELRLFILAD